MSRVTLPYPRSAPDGIDRLFGRYVLSSMVTMFLQSAYSLVDGLFVSNFVGGTALAAINVTWPIIAVITAVGAGVGCGGAVIMATQQGAGHRAVSNRVRGNVLLALLAAGVLCTAVALALLQPLLRLMGAEGELFRYALTYGRIMLAGGVVQVVSCGLSPLLRNDNHAVTAMGIMVGGLVANLALDFCFLALLHWGVAGAAAASVCAQLFTVLAGLAVLLTDRCNPLRPAQLRPNFRLWPRMLRNALSPFGISLTPSLLILYHNIACLRTGSDLAVSAYALITATVGSYRILLIGVADGIQPLASYANGAGDWNALHRLRNKGIGTAVAVSAALFAFTMATAGFYPALYGYSGQAAELSVHAVRVTAWQLLFTGLVRVTNGFFFAVGKTRYALFMIYFDPLVLTPAALLVLPRLLGLEGIWLTAVVTQLLLNFAAGWMFWRYSRALARKTPAAIPTERSRVLP